VESNIYVAKGLMSPYELAIDTAASAFEAIEKIKAGKVYDVVFMDHMMPKMDGMEATKILRALGYTRPIVALTANAVIGQSDIFLANGFDGFISKPIDVRQMDAALKKFVRDRRPLEAIEAAARRQEAGKRQEGHIAQPSLDPRLAEIVARDVSQSLAALEAVEKRGTYGDDDIRMYTVNVHGMKSALANAGERELSARAGELERAGREKNIAVISAETPAFLDALRAIIEKLAPPQGADKDSGAADEDPAYLREKLLIIQEACASYNKKVVKEALSGLREKTWSKQTQDLLGKIAEHLLDGDYAELSSTAEKLLETI